MQGSAEGRAVAVGRAEAASGEAKGRAGACTGGRVGRRVVQVSRSFVVFCFFLNRVMWLLWPFLPPATSLLQGVISFSVAGRSVSDHGISFEALGNSGALALLFFEALREYWCLSPVSCRFYGCSCGSFLQADAVVCGSVLPLCLT